MRVPYFFAARAISRQKMLVSGDSARDEAGEVDDPRAFLAEDAVEVEVADVEGAAYFAGAVIVDPRSAHTVAGVGDVDLVAVAPRAALVDFRPLVVDVPAPQVLLDEPRDRAAFHKGGQHLRP